MTTPLVDELFPGANGSAWPSGWALYASSGGLGGFTVEGGRGRMAIPNVPGYPGMGARREAVSLADVEVVFETGAQFDASSAVLAEHYHEVQVRLPPSANVGDGLADCYYLGLSPSETDPATAPWVAQIMRRRNGVIVRMTPDVFPVPAATRQIKGRFRVTGRRLQGRVWAANGTEPSTWALDYTDNSSEAILSAGTVGLAAFGGGVGAPNMWIDWENVQITSLSSAPTVTVEAASTSIWPDPVALKAVPGGGAGTLSWTVTTKPLGSAATVAAPTNPVTSFTPDKVGAYEITATVTNGSGSASAVARVEIFAQLWQKTPTGKVPVAVRKKPPVVVVPPPASNLRTLDTMVYELYGAPVRTDGQYPGQGKHELPLPTSPSFDWTHGANAGELSTGPYPKAAGGSTYSHVTGWGECIPTSAGTPERRVRLHVKDVQMWHLVATQAAPQGVWVKRKDQSTGGLNGNLEGGFWTTAGFQYSENPAMSWRTEASGGHSIDLLGSTNVDGTPSTQAILHWYYQAYYPRVEMVPGTLAVASICRMRLISDVPGVDVNLAKFVACFSGDFYISAESFVHPSGINPGIAVPRHKLVTGDFKPFGVVTGTEAQIRAYPAMPFLDGYVPPPVTSGTLESIPDLQMRVEAKSLSLTSGAGVQTAVDGSPQVNSISQPDAALRPTWIPNQVGGHPTFRFTGGQCFETSISNGTFPYTIFALVKWAGGGGTARTIMGPTGSGGLQLRLSGPDGDRAQLLKAAEAGLGSSATAVPANTWVLVTARFDGTGTAKFWINGVSGTTVSAAAGSKAGGAPAWRIAQSVTSEPFEGDMTALVMYNRALTDAEVAAAHPYFSNTYGVALS